MAEVVIDVAAVSTATELFDALFRAAGSDVPDYGGRNLDALLDDLGDAASPLTVVLSGVGRTQLDPEWLDRLLGTLAAATSRSGGRVSVVLRDGG